ncbi:hypothetical protein [Bacillus sp. PK3_68]|uniref:hypothetical protein n=1 Tax=Bacillus sp. PK3_68 TaxID=2027408 RepID=UPI000E75F941|nr:hypothetical protein [Bacillus sp. PK3_68]RJS60489.1 hypothetical protein CJ483_10740 [Bacillus sp. PK3_68]
MTPTERPKPRYGLAAAAGQEKSGRRSISVIANWSSRQGVDFQTPTEGASFVTKPAGMMNNMPDSYLE